MSKPQSISEYLYDTYLGRYVQFRVQEFRWLKTGVTEKPRWFGYNDTHDWQPVNVLSEDRVCDTRDMVLEIKKRHGIWTLITLQGYELKLYDDSVFETFNAKEDE